MTKKEIVNLQQVIANYHEAMRHQLDDDDRDAIKKKIATAEALLNVGTMKIVANNGVVSWWYSTETGHSMITYQGEDFHHKQNIGAAHHYGLCVFDHLQVTDKID